MSDPCRHTKIIHQGAMSLEWAPRSSGRLCHGTGSSRGKGKRVFLTLQEVVSTLIGLGERSHANLEERVSHALGVNPQFHQQTDIHALYQREAA